MKKLLFPIVTMFFLLVGFASQASASTNTYTVKSGDTLYRIATNHGITVDQLMNYNGLTSTTIYPNQVLNVKGAAKETTAAPAEKKADKVVKTLTVEASAFTANCKGCSGITATGVNLKQNPNAKVISVDPKVIPLGTKVHVEGYGYAVAADTGGAIKGNRIDVFMPKRQDALNWGRKTVKVQILE